MPPAISPEKLIASETLRGGMMWSRIIPRGQVLRLENTQGDASVAALFYNPAQTLERYNMPDTLKAQHTAHLTTGFVLYSDMGRILMSIVDDSYGWHDTITGGLSRKLSEEKYGAGTYQDLRNDWHRNTRDNFLVELGKYGLGKRDIVPNVNFFTKVVSDAEGNLSWASEKKPGSHIDLRAEMDVLVVLSNTPHPYEPSAKYAPSPVALTIWQAEPVAESDICRTKRPENGRGFTLTEAYNRSKAGAA
jgi:urea carboxylase-associated protein 2